MTSNSGTFIFQELMLIVMKVAKIIYIQINKAVFGGGSPKVLVKCVVLLDPEN